MDGIVENRKWREFPWKRKRSMRKMKFAFRALKYKKGQIWSTKAQQGMVNLSHGLGIPFQKLIKNLRAC